jgi:hypothetical protein
VVPLSVAQFAFADPRRVIAEDLPHSDPMRDTSPPVIDRMAQLDLAAVWGQPGVWIGLGLTAAFLFIAIRLRRDRELV